MYSRIGETVLQSLSTQDELKLIVNYAFLSGGLFFRSLLQENIATKTTDPIWTPFEALCLKFWNLFCKPMRMKSLEKKTTVWVTDYTTQTPSKHFSSEKCLSSTPLKNEKIFMKCAQK